MSQLRTAAALLVLAAPICGCAKQAAPGSMNPPPVVEGAPVRTTMQAQLATAGLHPGSLPAMSQLTRAQREAIMPTFNEALGVECEHCHTDDRAEETPNIRVTRKMWDLYSRAMTLTGGHPLYCDSCHQGKAVFLPREAPDRVQEIMELGYVNGLRRLDGRENTCAGCHGDPLVTDLVEAWGEGLEPFTPPDLATSPSDMPVAFDMAVPPGGDAAMPPGDMASGGLCKVLLNEVQVGTAAGASEEFVEVINPCAMSIVVDNWSLVYRSAAGTTDNVMVAFGTRTLGPGAYLVAGTSTFTGTKALTFSATLAAAGGGVGLRDAGGALVDSLGYGTATNAFVQGSAAITPANGKTVARTLNGTIGVGNNSLDWSERDPTPGAAN